MAMPINIIPRTGKFEKIIVWIFILSLLTGALRKWVFTSGAIGNSILAVQLCIPYLLLFSGNKYIKPWKYSIIIVYMSLLVCMAFNPMNLTYFHGILGYILHFGFWFSIAYYLANRQVIDFQPIIPLLLIGCLIEIVLGFIQYQLPASHWLNTYADLKSVGGDIALVGGSVRITGTFSYISGFTAFVYFLIFFTWYLFRVAYNYTIISILYLSGLLVSLMSGSRQAVGVYLIVSILIIFSELSWEKGKVFIAKMMLPFIFLFSIFLIKGNIGIEDKVINAFDNFNERRETNNKNGEESQRIFSDLNDLLQFRGNYPILGVGLGSTYQGATAVFGTSDYVKEYGYYENELTRVVLEGGFVLLVFRLLLVVVFMFILNVNVLCKVFIGILIFYFTPVVFNIYNNIFFMLGLILVDNAKKENY